MNAIQPYLWPLAFLLVVFVILHYVRESIKPIVGSLVSGLAKQAQANATAYAIALGFGLSASLSAFIDVFKDLNSVQFSALSWHQYLALWAKVLNPFLVAILAYSTQSKFRSGQSSETKPPFPPT